MTCQEVSKTLGCSIDQVLDLVDDGSLAAINIAGEGTTRRALRFPLESVKAFIQKRRTA